MTLDPFGSRFPIGTSVCVRPQTQPGGSCARVVSTTVVRCCFSPLTPQAVDGQTDAWCRTVCSGSSTC